MLRRVWQTASVVACLALSVPLAPPAEAQETTPAQGQQPQSPAQERSTPAPEPAAPASEQQAPKANAAEAQPKPIEDKSVAEFAAALEEWRSKVNGFEEAVADETASDEDFREIPEQLDVLQRQIVDRKSLLRPKLDEARARLDKLGPAPKENGPKESPETTAQRERLNADFAAIDGLMKQADVVLVRARQLADTANAERRERFTKSLFRPVPSFYSNVLPVGPGTRAAPDEIDFWRDRRLDHARGRQGPAPPHPAVGRPHRRGDRGQAPARRHRRLPSRQASTDRERGVDAAAARRPLPCSTPSAMRRRLGRPWRRSISSPQRPSSPIHHGRASSPKRPSPSPGGASLPPS